MKPATKTTTRTRKATSPAPVMAAAPTPVREINPNQHYSIRPGAFLHAEISQRADLTSRGKDKLSQHVVGKRDLERYYGALASARDELDLTTEEAIELVTAIRGVATLKVEPVEAWMTFERGVGPRLTPEQRRLSNKLRQMTVIQAVAMLDAVERYWLRHPSMTGFPKATDAVDIDMEGLADVGLIRRSAQKSAASG